MTSYTKVSMFVSRITGHCGLLAWEDNSEVIRAVSTAGPLGEFKMVETVVPRFAHNPVVVAHRTSGLLHLYHIGKQQHHPQRSSLESWQASCLIYADVHNSNDASQHRHTEVVAKQLVLQCNARMGLQTPLHVPSHQVVLLATGLTSQC